VDSGSLLSVIQWELNIDEHSCIPAQGIVDPREVPPSGDGLCDYLQKVAVPLCRLPHRPERLCICMSALQMIIANVTSANKLHSMRTMSGKASLRLQQVEVGGVVYLPMPLISHAMTPPPLL